MVRNKLRKILGRSFIDHVSRRQLTSLPREGEGRLLQRKLANHVSHRKLTTLPTSAEVVIIGGGVVGASTAYHMADRGRGEGVLLLEANKITSGTTWHSAAMLNTLRGNATEGKLVDYTKHLVINVLETQTGVSPGYVKRGGLTVTKEPDRMDEFRRMVSLTKYTGNSARMVTPAECQEMHPLLHTTDILGGLYSDSDGSADPTGLTTAYVKGARDGGVFVSEDCRVEEIIVEGGKVRGVRTNQGDVEVGAVVVSAGAWSAQLLEGLGVSVPLKPSEHSYVITDIIPELGPTTPNVRDNDASIYAKVQGQTLYLGAFEPNPNFWEPDPGFAFGLFDLDWDVFLPMLEAHSHRMPPLDHIGHKSVISGPESFTPDKMPLFGPTPEVTGLFLNCAMNSKGVQLSGGLGREMAKLLLDGNTHLDMWPYHINRFQAASRHNKAWLDQKTHESHVKMYHVPFPSDQPLSGRNLLLSPLHATMRRAGAFFGVAGLWERPMFFVPDYPSDITVRDYDWYGCYGRAPHAKYPYKYLLKEQFAAWSYGKTVSDAISAECRQCRDDVVIFDQSSFGKLVVSGPGALAGLEWLSTARMDRPVGTCVYTLMLNKGAGIECDLTVTRTGPESFYLVTGAGALQHTQSWVTRGLETRGCLAKVKDVSADMGVINLQGPNSRAVLEQLVPDIAKLEFSRCVQAVIGGAEVMVLRLTYVGELGYELHVPAQSSQQVLDAILAVRDVPFAGMEAMESLCVEKGYHHWPADIQMTDNPLEAGMGFVCKLKSTLEFFGRSSLETAKKCGLAKRLVCLSFDPSVPLNGQEPILVNGVCKGYIRRAAEGHTVKRVIGYGYVEGEGSSMADLAGADISVDVSGTQFAATLHKGPLYDAKGTKFKDA